MNTKFDITIIVYGLALFSGISYLWGFWLYFDVNILSYIALTDIIKASVYPALPAIGVLAIYSAMDGYNSISKKQHQDMIDEGGFFKGFTYFVKFYAILLASYAIINTVYLIITEIGYHKLKGFYPLISISLFFYIIFSNKYLLKIPLNARVFLVSIFCFLPSYLFHKGNSNGAIAANHEAQGYYVLSKGYCNSTKIEKFRFIGVIGNKLFSHSSKDNSICIAKAEDFRLTKYNIDNKNKIMSAASNSLKQEK